MEIDSESLSIPPTEYDARVTMPSSEFSRIVRDLSLLGESVKIEVSKEGVRFSSEGEVANGNVLLKQTDGARDKYANYGDEDDEVKQESEDEEEASSKKTKTKKLKKDQDADENAEDDEGEFKSKSDDEGEEEVDESSSKKRKKPPTKVSRYGHIYVVFLTPNVRMVHLRRSRENLSIILQKEVL